MPIIAALVGLVLGAIAAIAYMRTAKQGSLHEADEKIQSAHAQAESLIGDAKRQAETLKKEALLEAKEEIIKNNIGKFESIDVNKNVAKVSIVGAGMQSNAGVAAKMFEALYDENINIRMISTSEIRVTVLIDEQYTERAMNAIHDKFALGDR